MIKDNITKCSSCSVDITNSNGAAEFNCPNCGKYRFVRCKDCRANSIKYVCTECEFEGPN